eukprot:1043433-Alexandrium_andersonii.AAC.1
MSPIRNGPHRSRAASSVRSACAPHSASGGPWPAAAQPGAGPGAGPGGGGGWWAAAGAGPAEPDAAACR